MTLPALPPEGSTAWYPHYTGLHDVAAQVDGSTETGRAVLTGADAPTIRGLLIAMPGAIRIWDGTAWSGRPAGVPAGYVLSVSDGSYGSTRDPAAPDPGGLDGDMWRGVSA